VRKDETLSDSKAPDPARVIRDGDADLPPRTCRLYSNLRLARVGTAAAILVFETRHRDRGGSPRRESTCLATLLPFGQKFGELKMGTGLALCGHLIPSTSKQARPAGRTGLNGETWDAT
jgi:hypothetical protein